MRRSASGIQRRRSQSRNGQGTRSPRPALVSPEIARTFFRAVSMVASGFGRYRGLRATRYIDRSRNPEIGPKTLLGRTTENSDRRRYSSRLQRHFRRNLHRRVRKRLESSSVESALTICPSRRLHQRLHQPPKKRCKTSHFLSKRQSTRRPIRDAVPST